MAQRRLHRVVVALAHELQQPQHVGRERARRELLLGLLLERRLGGRREADQLLLEAAQLHRLVLEVELPLGDLLGGEAQPRAHHVEEGVARAVVGLDGPVAARAARAREVLVHRGLHVAVAAVEQRLPQLQPHLAHLGRLGAREHQRDAARAHRVERPLAARPLRRVRRLQQLDQHAHRRHRLRGVDAAQQLLDQVVRRPLRLDVHHRRLLVVLRRRLLREELVHRGRLVPVRLAAVEVDTRLAVAHVLHHLARPVLDVHHPRANRKREALVGVGLAGGGAGFAGGAGRRRRLV